MLASLNSARCARKIIADNTVGNTDHLMADKACRIFPTIGNNTIGNEGLAPDEPIGLFRSLSPSYRFVNGLPFALVPDRRLKIVRTKTRTVNFHDFLVDCLSL